MEPECEEHGKKKQDEVQKMMRKQNKLQRRKILQGNSEKPNSKSRTASSGGGWNKNH